MKPIKRTARRAITELHLGLDRGEWLPVAGVVDVVLQGGTFKLDSGKEEQGHHATITLDLVKFDDGQAAIDAALSRRGKLRARIIGHRRTLFGELQPYRVDGQDGKRYTVSARVTNTSWGTRP